jgi:hypothetical protein
MAGWVAIVLALGLYWRNQGFETFKRRSVARVADERSNNDFKHMYLGAVFLKGWLNPYDPAVFRPASTYEFQSINPYVYPPTTGIVMRPLASLDFPRAAAAWFYLNHLMLLASLAICIHLFLGWRNPWPIAAVVFAAAVSFPLWKTLSAGQLNCLLLLLFCGAYWALAARRQWAAGLLLGLGTMIKILPGIFVLYFAAQRAWRALGWMAAWTLIIFAVSVALVGWQRHAAFVPVLREMGYGRSVWKEILLEDGIEPFYRDPANQSFNSFFHHIAALDPLSRMWPWFDLSGREGWQLANRLTYGASLIVLALAAWGLMVAELRRKAQGNAAGENTALALPHGRASALGSALGYEFSLMILLSLLLPSIMWDHYLVILLLPQIVLWGGYVRSGRLLSIRMLLLAAASAVISWPMGYVLTRQGLTAMFVNDFGLMSGRAGALIGAVGEGPGLVVMSVRLFAVLVLYGLTLDALRPVRSTAFRRNSCASAPPKGGTTN